MNSSNVDFNVHEDNQNLGACGPEDRIHFRIEQGAPECLKRMMTRRRAGIYGRINCKKFYEEIRSLGR